MYSWQDISQNIVKYKVTYIQCKCQQHDQIHTIIHPNVHCEDLNYIHKATKQPDCVITYT